jgi:hypothetical protein
MFADLLRGNAVEAMAPLELAALAKENADLLPKGEEGDKLQGRLADRLWALDLPKRAEPGLEKLMQATPTRVGRATFGARLAALRWRETDVAGAFAARSASAEADLPAEMAESRTLLLAAAHARRGDTDRALAARPRRRWSTMLPRPFRVRASQTTDSGEACSAWRRPRRGQVTKRR